MEQEIRNKFGDNVVSITPYGVTLRCYDRRHNNDLQEIILKHGFKILTEIGGLNNDMYTIVYSNTK